MLDDIQKKLKSPLFLLFLLFFISSVLKLYKMSPVFSSSDDLWIPYQVIKYYPHHMSQFINFDGSTDTVNPLSLLMLSHNIFIYLFNILFVTLMDLFGFGLNEFVWRLPVVLMSSLIIFPAYYLVRLFTDSKFAFISAVYVAFLPTLFSLSRSPGAFHVIIELFFQFITVLFFCKYFSEGRKYALPASISLSLYLISGTFVPLIIALIIYIGFVYNFKGSFIKSVKKTLTGILKFDILFLPLLTIIFLSLIFFGSKIVIGDYAGDWAHILVVSQNSYSYLSLDYTGYLTSIYMNFNMLIFPFVILALLYSLRFLINFQRESIFVVWFLLWASPFLLYFHDPYYYTYVTYSACTLLILVPIIIYSIIRKNDKFSFLSIILFFILFGLIIGSFNSAYGLNVPEALSVPRALGSYSSDNGVKTAGYWIRQNTPSDFKVYSDASGGGGIEPWIVIYYTLRDPLTLFDADTSEIRNLFLSRFKDADIFLITPQNKEWTENNSPEKIFLNVRIASNKNEVLYIYSKRDSPTITMSTEEYNKKFDELYSKSILDGSVAFNRY